MRKRWLISFYERGCHYVCKYPSEELRDVVEAHLAEAGVVRGLAADDVTPFYFLETPEQRRTFSRLRKEWHRVHRWDGSLRDSATLLPRPAVAPTPRR